MSIYSDLATCHPSLKRGQVWCRHCGKTSKVNVEKSFRYGWKKCCGFTMTIDKPILEISYPHQWGGHIADRKFWQGKFKGQSDVLDWNTKEALIQDAKNNDWDYEIYKLNRKSKKLELVYATKKRR